MISAFFGRLGIALFLFIFSAGAYRWYIHQVADHAKKQAYSATGKPTILFFSTPDCAVCHTVQAPALAQLEEQLAQEVQIIDIDACEEPELAKDWRVLSVPTLVVLDTKGELVSIKHGAQSATDLLVELQPLVTR